MSAEQAGQAPIYSRGCAHSIWAKVNPDHPCRKMAWFLGGAASITGGLLWIGTTLPTPTPVAATIGTLLILSGMVEMGVGVAGIIPGEEERPFMIVNP